MEGCFGASFAENFEGLAKLLSDHEVQKPPSPSTVSCAQKPGPAGIGPQGIFPDVKVAEPKGEGLILTLTDPILQRVRS
jgi:hypothetical protein